MNVKKGSNNQIQVSHATIPTIRALSNEWNDEMHSFQCITNILYIRL